MIYIGNQQWHYGQKLKQTKKWSIVLGLEIKQEKTTRWDFKKDGGSGCWYQKNLGGLSQGYG